MLTQDDIKILEEPFPEDSLGFKVQSLSKNRDKALIVPYLDHVEVVRRLEKVDPAWTCEAVDVIYPEKDALCMVRMRLTLKGVTRENTGDGNDAKAAFSDALKRCAMSFGIGRYLYQLEGSCWANYDETKDRFKRWTFDDYKRFLKGSGVSAASPPDRTLTPSGPSSPAPITRGQEKAATDLEKAYQSIDELMSTASEMGLGSPMELSAWAFADATVTPSRIKDIKNIDLLRRAYKYLSDLIKEGPQ